MSRTNTKSSSSSVLVLHNATIVTLDPQGRVFLNGAVVIEDDTIKAIGHSHHGLTQFSSSSPQLVDLNGQFLLPATGKRDSGVDLLTWLHHPIWPYESNMTQEDSYISTLLCGSNLFTPVTCFAEAGGQHVSGMARPVELLGLRACLADSIMDSSQGLPVAWANRTTEQCIQSQKELYKKYHNTADGRIRMWLGIRQILNSTDRLLSDTRDTAKELKTGIHMHVAEIPYENLVVVDTRRVDHGTVSYLEKIKLLNKNLLAAHTVWVNKDGVSFLSNADVKVSYCPAAAIRMLGFAAIREMLDAGVCVSGNRRSTIK